MNHEPELRKMGEAFELVNEQLAAITAERDELRKELRRLLSVVNAVTAPHRHGIPVTRNALDNLANRQIEVESTLNRHLGGE